MRNYLFIVGALLLSFAVFSPGGEAHAAACNAYTQITTTVPYGSSASRADLYTVKVINNSPLPCDASTLTITPRVGLNFTSIDLQTAPWKCDPAVGNSPVICHTQTCTTAGEPPVTTCVDAKIPAWSITTVRVRYDRPFVNSPVSGAATATITTP